MFYTFFEFMALISIITLYFLDMRDGGVLNKINEEPREREEESMNVDYGTMEGEDTRDSSKLEKSGFIGN
jgi:hypothetical protein